MVAMSRYVNPVRLVAGTFVLALMLAPAYFFVIRDEAGPGIQRAEMLATVASGDVGLGVGQYAPDFEISTPEGKRVRLSELRGRPAVVNFWATWCGSCLTEMPDLKALQEERGVDNVSVLAINAGETRAQADEFIDFLDAPFVFALDPGLVVSDAYGVYGLPLSVFLDSEGVVRGVYRGHAQPEILEILVKAAFDAAPHGELPVVLRTVTHIPRERVLTVSDEEDGLRFEGRSLRCDVSYCAGEVAGHALRAIAGVRDAAFAGAGGTDRALVVHLEAGAGRETVIEGVKRALESVPDPVYDQPIVVKDR
jgi:peroxiredoxin